VTNVEGIPANSIDQARDLLSPYLDGEATPAERALVEAALAQSPALQAELESLRQTVSMVNALPHIPAPRPFTITEADVGLAPVANPSPWRRWFKPMVGVAAALAAVLVVVFVASTLRGGQYASETSSVAFVPQKQETMQEAAPQASSVSSAEGKAEAPKEVPPPEAPATELPQTALSKSAEVETEAGVAAESAPSVDAENVPSAEAASPAPRMGAAPQQLSEKAVAPPANTGGGEPNMGVVPPQKAAEPAATPAESLPAAAAPPQQPAAGTPSASEQPSSPTGLPQKAEAVTQPPKTEITQSPPTPEPSAWSVLQSLPIRVLAPMIVLLVLGIVAAAFILARTFQNK